MLIAILSPYYGIVHRGAEQHAEKVKKSFEELGHNVYILSIDKKKYNKTWEDNVTNSLIGSAFKKYIGIEPSISQMSYVRQLFKSDIEVYDLLWSNGEYFTASFCKSVRDYYDIPFVVTSHSNKSALLKSIAHLEPDLYAVLTPQHLEYLKGMKGNIKCIPLGADTEMFKPERQKRESFFEHPIFLSTAALLPAKRIDLVINAISKLDKGTLMFTGTGPQYNKLIELAEKKLGSHRYVYLGDVDRKTLPAIYNSCDYYVNASKSEGLSISIYEAMACNLPVIYHKDETRDWQVGPGGIGVDTTNEKEFVDVLKHIKDNNFNNWPRYQAEKYNWNNSVKMYDEEIKKVV